MTDTQITITTNNTPEQFDLLELPDPKSQLIKAKCSVITGDINIQELVSDFSQLSQLIRLAENGAAGRYQIQIQIRDIGRIITRLAGDTSVAIYEFHNASSEVAETLKSVYEYLLDSFEDEALITLAGIEQIAKQMLDASEKLREDARMACLEVQKTSNAAMKQKGEDEEAKKRLDNEIEGMKIEEAKYNETKKDVDADICQLDTKLDKAVENIEKAEKSASTWGIVGVFVPFVSTDGVVKNAKEKAEKDRQEKQRLFEEQRKQIAARREINANIATFALKIQQCKDQSVLAETVIKSLNHAIGALSKIEAIMESARIFWEKMYLHCKKLSTENIRKKITNGLEKHDESRRQQLYHSDSFKEEVIKVYSVWIAVRETCHLYKDQIEANHNDFLEYLKENPSREQSLTIVTKLAAKLLSKTK